MSSGRVSTRTCSRAGRSPGRRWAARRCCARSSITGCGIFLESHEALILPIAPLAAFDAEIQYPGVVAGVPQPDYLGWMKAVCHVTVTGHPAISVPAGFAPDGTPVGVQIVGRHRGERDLLAIAAAFENLTGYAGMHPRLG